MATAYGSIQAATALPLYSKANFEKSNFAL